MWVSFLRRASREIIRQDPDNVSVIRLKGHGATKLSSRRIVVFGSFDILQVLQEQLDLNPLGAPSGWVCMTEQTLGFVSIILLIRHMIFKNLALDNIQSY
jgi:hypothetical protein